MKKYIFDCGILLKRRAAAVLASHKARRAGESEIMDREAAKNRLAGSRITGRRALEYGFTGRKLRNAEPWEALYTGEYRKRERESRK